MRSALPLGSSKNFELSYLPVYQKRYFTMAIKVKAVERNVSFEKNSEKWAYVLQTDLYNRLSDAKVIQEAALRSGGLT